MHKIVDVLAVGAAARVGGDLAAAHVTVLPVLAGANLNSLAGAGLVTYAVGHYALGISGFGNGWKGAAAAVVVGAVVYLVSDMLAPHFPDAAKNVGGFDVRALAAAMGVSAALGYALNGFHHLEVPATPSAPVPVVQ